MLFTLFSHKGPSINHIDRFWDFFDPSLPLCRQFYYIGLFSKVDIWPTPPPPSLVYMVYGSPLITTNQIILPFVPQIRLKSDVTKNGCEKFLERKASGTIVSSSGKAL